MGSKDDAKKKDGRRETDDVRDDASDEGRTVDDGGTSRADHRKHANEYANKTGDDGNNTVRR